MTYLYYLLGNIEFVFCGCFVKGDTWSKISIRDLEVCLVLLSSLKTDLLSFVMVLLDLTFPAVSFMLLVPFYPESKGKRDEVQEQISLVTQANFYSWPCQFILQ